MEWEGVEHFLSDSFSWTLCRDGLVIHNKPLSIVPQFMLTERLWSVGGVLGSFRLEPMTWRLNRWVMGWNFKPLPRPPPTPILQGRERGVRNWVQSPVTHGLISCAYVVKPPWKPLKPGLGDFQQSADWPTSNNVSWSRWPDSFVKRIFVD